MRIECTHKRSYILGFGVLKGLEKGAQIFFSFLSLKMASIIQCIFDTEFM